MDFTETYTLAHTARCKLKLAADRPDRDLRFILGHAFTLDKLRLRLAEIEVSDEDDFYPEDDGQDHPTCTGNAGDAPVAAEPKARRVSFNKSHDGRPDVAPHRQRSPPPDQFAQLSDSDSSSDEEDYEDMEGNLSLQRFASAATQPPRMIPDLEADDNDEEDDVAEPRSPTEEELRMITGGEGSMELKDAYSHVAGCPCHGEVNAPNVERVWEVPRKQGDTGPRVAIVQVAA